MKKKKIEDVNHVMHMYLKNRTSKKEDVNYVMLQF